jgi:tetratricopeptide (TPR) repeat protein
LFHSLATGPDREKYAGRAIDARIDAAVPLGWIDRGAEAVRLLREARAQIDAHISEFGRTPENLERLAHVEASLAETLGRQADEGKGTYADGLRHADQAIAVYDEHLSVADKKDKVRRSLAIALFKRALILYSMERDRLALADLERAEALAREHIARDPRDDGLERILNSVLEQKAITLAYAGEKQRAVEVARESLRAKRQRAQAMPVDRSVQREYASNLILIGSVFEIVADKPESCRLYRQARDLFDRLDRERPLSDYDRKVVTRDLAKFIARTC